MRASASAAILVVLTASAAWAAPPPHPSIARKALETLRAADAIESSHIGDGGMPSAVYAAFERLRGAATKRRLRELASDASPVVRFYATYALLQRHGRDRDVQDLVLERLADEQSVDTVSGCSAGRATVAEEVLDVVEDQLDREVRSAILARVLAASAGSGPLRLVLRQVWWFGPEHRAALEALAARGEPGAREALERISARP